MPTSDLFNASPLVSIASAIKPASVLDVGCGFGKYGVLLREALDIWQGRYARETWTTRIVGLDAFPEYRNPIWDFAYTEVKTGRAQDLLDQLGEFDLILIADVIEHFEKATALSVIDAALRQSNYLLISTPKDYYPQDAHFGNDYERHLCHVGLGDFPADCQVRRVPALSCNIFLASRKRAISDDLTYLASLPNLVYLQARHELRRLGRLGYFPAAIARAVNRLLSG